MLWFLGVRVVSPSLVIFCNFAFTILAGLARIVYRKPVDPGVVAFILVTHAIPVWLVRKAPIDIRGSVIVFLVYLLSLRLQGKTLIGIWRDMWVEPPKTIGDYLHSRGLI